MITSSKQKMIRHIFLRQYLEAKKDNLPKFEIIVKMILQYRQISPFCQKKYIAKVDPSPSGRRPDLTAKGKKEFVALSPGKSGMENRGKFKQRCTLAYTFRANGCFLDQRFPHRIAHNHNQLVWTLAQEAASEICQ
ncbi:hypothetical protein J3Q64DRAFT_1693020 [Phycomyces blakesleeanus]|uniref:Homeodomain-like DNA binding domain-containing transcription factor n=1 Tax=Phycomyces blakesleeanus TaxID=4837 RepID=A0ABR3BDS0_PHYBL